MKSEKNQELYGGQPQKSQGIKFVITTVLVAVVILGIAVWGVVFAVSNAKNKAGLAQTNQTETSKQTEKDTSSQEIVEVTEIGDATETTEGVSSSEPEPEAAAEQPAPATSEVANIPKTGPEDYLPVALLSGLLVAFLGSKRLVKSVA